MKLLPWNNTLQLQLDDIYTRLKFFSHRKRDFILENNAIDTDYTLEFDKGEDSIGEVLYKFMVSAWNWPFSAQKKQHSSLNVLRKVETQRTWHILYFHEFPIHKILRSLTELIIVQKTLNLFLTFAEYLHNYNNHSTFSYLMLIFFEDCEVKTKCRQMSWNLVVIFRAFNFLPVK